MSTQRIVALLDIGVDRSFGMMPFLVADGEPLSNPIVVGQPGGPKPMETGGETVETIVEMPLVTDVRSSCLSYDAKMAGHVAGWIGNAFMERCRALGVHAPDLPGALHGRVGGAFWTEPSAACFRRMERWLAEAADTAFTSRSRDVAELMAWCLPLDERTEAALWHTAPDDDRREHALASALQRRPKRGRGLKRALRTRWQLIVDYHTKTA